MVMGSRKEYLVLSVVMLAMAVSVAASAGAAVGTAVAVASSVGAAVGTAVAVASSVGAAVGTAVAVSVGVSVAVVVSATVDLFDSIRPATTRASAKRTSRIGLRLMIGFLLAMRGACL
jgi:hypothetical protein